MKSERWPKLSASPKLSQRPFNPQIINLSDVHFVQIKCLLLTADRIAAARQLVATQDFEVDGASRGASALGIALALGEIETAAAEAATVGENTQLEQSQPARRPGSNCWGMRSSCLA